MVKSLLEGSPAPFVCKLGKSDNQTKQNMRDMKSVDHSRTNCLLNQWLVFHHFFWGADSLLPKELKKSHLRRVRSNEVPPFEAADLAPSRSCSFVEGLLGVALAGTRLFEKSHQVWEKNEKKSPSYIFFLLGNFCRIFLLSEKNRFVLFALR